MFLYWPDMMGRIGGEADLRLVMFAKARDVAKNSTIHYLEKEVE